MSSSERTQQQFSFMVHTAEEVQEINGKLREATNSLYDHYCKYDFPSWLQCIGESGLSQYNDKAEIKIMLTRKLMHFEGEIPREWQGFPVETRVIGEIVIRSPIEH